MKRHMTVGYWASATGPCSYSFFFLLHLFHLSHHYRWISVFSSKPCERIILRHFQQNKESAQEHVFWDCYISCYFTPRISTLPCHLHRSSPCHCAAWIQKWNSTPLPEIFWHTLDEDARVCVWAPSSLSTSPLWTFSCSVEVISTFECWESVARCLLSPNVLKCTKCTNLTSLYLTYTA